MNSLPNLNDSGKSLHFFAAALTGLCAVNLFAQTAPSTPVTGTASEEAVKLDPFSVRADADVGFVAATSLAGGRMATSLKDTPVSYSVITKEFLDAFNVQDVVAAAQWSTNINQNEADNSMRMYGNSPVTSVRSRGIQIGLPTRNFFTVSGTGDSYNVDRVDIARGPNSSLFGAGSVAGSINTMTKQAEPARKFEQVEIKVGSWGHTRLSADVNQPVTSQIAVRANVLFDTSQTWRDNEWTEKRGVTLAAKYNLTPKLSLRGELEYRKSLDGTGSAVLLDNISAWDGKTTLGLYPTNGSAITMTPAQLAAAGFVLQSQRFVGTAGSSSPFLNFQNTYKTRGAVQNAVLANSNQINGVPIVTTGFTLQGQAMIGAEDGVPTDRWTRALGGSPFFSLPKRTDTSWWTNRSLPLARETGKNAQLLLDYTPTENLFFEIGGAVDKSNQMGETTQRRGLLDVKIDVNRFLPDGNPNPGFLEKYVEYFNYRNTRNYEQAQLRVQGVYRRNVHALGRDLGRFQFSVLGGATNQRLASYGQENFMPMKSLAPDARSWIDGAAVDSAYGAYTRFNLDGSSRIWRDVSGTTVTTYNRLNGVTEQVKPTFMYDVTRPDNNSLGWQKFRFAQGAANLDLFKNHLVLIGAFRRDITSIYTRRVNPPGDEPVGWDGTTLAWRPDAPVDYFNLKYSPKDTKGNITGAVQPATSRPRGRASTDPLTGDRANVGLPQYANDRFQDDYSAPIYNKGVNTWTVGGVLNATKSIGVYANRSTTFGLVLPAVRIDGSLVPPTSAVGTDFGIRFTLPGNRLSISVGRYSSYQEGATIRIDTGTINNIGSTPVIGDLTSTGRNQRGLNALPLGIFSTLTDATKGYEFESTANLTSSLRLTLNVAYNDATQKDRMPDILAFYPKIEPTFRQILADGGAKIDPVTNLAVIDPAYNDPTKINQTQVQVGVDAWNNYINTVKPGLAANVPLPELGTTKWTANVAADYRFRTGPLAGLRVGVGGQFRTGQYVGSHVSDTIRNPNNPNQAIDDPDVGLQSPLFAASYTKMVASMSYTMHLKESGRLRPKTIQFDLNIDNLLNEDRVVYANINFAVQTGVTLFRPRIGEDITSPARRTVPGNFGYITPRNFTLSAKLNY